MAANDGKNVLETQILAQLAEIEEKISSLNHEKLTLQRILTRVRQQNVSVRDVTRKNSYNKILVESTIIKVLTDSVNPVSTAAIFSSVKNINFHINDNTFRSHLHRLKERGLIKQSSRRGYWMLPPSAEKTA